MKKYIPTIGIECHVQLKTKTKLFSGADNDARDAGPNTKVSPICFGLPGTLPVLNQNAVHLAVRAGIALKSEILRISRFERKHYFYPDLPKGYQTTQLAEPIIGPGEVEIMLVDNSTKKVRIHHAHLEEDAGKLTHPVGKNYSLVDLNRAGTPLIEVVSEPDMHSGEEAKAYAQELYLLMTYAGVTNGDLYHGNMRFDVNVSVAFEGEKLGIRTETKNLNSFRSIERAVDFEIKRQIELLESGEEVVQETRGWDDDRQETFSQRSKENAHDYRYFPDADIPPIVLSDEEIVKIQSEVPTLPNEYRQRWSTLGLDKSVINTVLSHQEVAILLDRIYNPADRNRDSLFGELDVDEKKHSKLVRRIFNWFASTPDEEMNIKKVAEGLVDSSRLVQLALLAEDGKISSNSTKEIFLYLFNDDSQGRTPEEIAKERNILQMSDEGDISKVVDEVMDDPASAASIADIKSGKDKAIGYLVGQVMKKSQGKANPALAQKLIRERL